MWRLYYGGAGENDHVYLKQGHVGAIVAVVAFVVVRVVDKGTVFLRDAIS